MRNYPSFLTTLVALVIGIALLQLFNLSFPVTVTTTQKAADLSVVGEGKVDVVPDTAYIDVGVTVNDAKDVTAAQQTIDKTNNAIIAGVTKLGVKKEDVKTSNYSVYPNYGTDGIKITGYNGNVTVTIKVMGTDKASQVIQAATAAGANQIQGTRFVVEDPQKYRDEAREKAIANAREQAEKLAKNLGIKLGKVTNVSEDSPSIQPPVYADSSMKMAASGSGGPELEAGTQTITSVVTLYFEKK